MFFMKSRSGPAKAKNRLEVKRIDIFLDIVSFSVHDKGKGKEVRVISESDFPIERQF